MTITILLHVDIIQLNTYVSRVGHNFQALVSKPNCKVGQWVKDLRYEKWFKIAI